MRIGAVVHQFPPDATTGTEILCLRSAQAMIARGHDVRVFSGDRSTPSGAPPRAETVEGVDVRRIGSRRPPRLLLARRIAEEFSNPPAARHLIAALRAFAPDVIHLYHAQQFGLAVVPELAHIAPVLSTVTDFHLVCPLVTAALEDGSPCDGPGPDGAACVAHLRRRETARLGTERGAGRAALAVREHIRRLPAADTPGRLAQAMAARLRASEAALAAISLTLVGPPRLYDMLKDGFGARVQAFGHAAPPLDVPARAVGTPLNVGYFSSLSHHKGLHVLLDAIALIPQDVPMTFTICGPPGPDANYVRAMTTRAAADRRVTLSHGVPHHRMGEALGAADIVVIPSLWDENNPLVLLDALEAGRYVVASAAPGMRDELGEPRGGVSVPAGNAQALAAALRALADDPSAVLCARAQPVRTSMFPQYIDAIEAHYAALTTGRSQPSALAS
ncbi:MAG: glycosyltransferase [Alphaproteobacteria bacterium]|nr:glycosyltransferase [Alphaproteobacteria bacterium]